MKHLGTILLGLAALMVVFGGSGRSPSAAGPTASAPSAVPAATAAARPAGFAAEAIRIDRDGSGQFHLDAAVNSNPTRFLIDTGADVVALTEGDAQRAGIPFGPADFQPILQTASGQGWGAPVRLERLEIGHTEMRDVEAVIVRDLAVSLLGQSVLGRIGRVELQGDQMLIEPRG